MDFRSERVLVKRLKELCNDGDTDFALAVFKELRRRGYFARDVILSNIPDDVLADVIQEVTLASR